jgi:hypothetical protein
VRGLVMRRACFGSVVWAPLLMRRSRMIVLRRITSFAIIWRFDDCVIVDEIRVERAQFIASCS